MEVINSPKNTICQLKPEETAYLNIQILIKILNNKFPLEESTVPKWVH